MRTWTKATICLLLVFFVSVDTYAKFWVTWNSPVTLEIIPFEDNEPPVIENVRHEPLYPNSTDLIYFYADVTDNVGVSLVQLNYTGDGGATWLLKDMPLLNGTTYSTSLGLYPQFQIIGFYVVAYDTSGNKAIGSEIVPPLPEPPRVAPIVVSDEPPNPLPDGEDVGYNVTETGVEVYVNTTELGLGPGPYTIIYSLDGGITWIYSGMTYIGGFVWSHVIPAFTNILFRVEASDSSSSMVYWIIVGPWEYPIYLHFSTSEQYYPVKGLDFDGDANVSNNWISYETTPDYWKYNLVNNDIDDDGVAEVWSYAYMNPKTLDDGCLVIEYWIYYAFNRYPIIGDLIRDDHEHDFESVYLWIDLATGNIKKIACTQHKWVNHYIFDVTNPPLAINLAVENGGHGMALLTDQNNDGFPDVNILGSYIIQPGVNPFGGVDVPMFFRDAGTINPSSFVAQLYPWVIYDPRIPSPELHLFDDPSILTNGLSLDIISPMLPNIVGEIPQYYGYLTDLLITPCVLKTSYGASLQLPSDLKLVFQVVAPLYRQEFREPGKFWWKLSFGWWATKTVVLFAVRHYVSEGLHSYFREATRLGHVALHVAEHVTGDILHIVFDPVKGSVMDFQGHVLGYSDVYNDLPGGVVFATRNMTTDLYDLFLIMTNSSSEYIYDVEGIESDESYNFTVSRMDAEGDECSFDATEIPIMAGAIHRYAVNWTMLENEELCVEVYVDQDGDGTFEHEFSSDSELTGDEFELAIAHDVTVKTIVPYKNVVGKGYPLLINLTIANQGSYTENFNVTVYANTTGIFTLMNTTLTNGNSTTVTFTWNTADIPHGNYTISANATIVSGETDKADNSKTDGWVLVTIPGNINGDGKVNILDAIKLAGSFESEPYDDHWNPNADINNDEKVNILDAIILAGHFGETV